MNMMKKVFKNIFKRKKPKKDAATNGASANQAAGTATTEPNQPTKTTPAAAAPAAAPAAAAAAAPAAAPAVDAKKPEEPKPAGETDKKPDTAKVNDGRRSFPRRFVKRPLQRKLTLDSSGNKRAISSTCCHFHRP